MKRHVWIDRNSPIDSIEIIIKDASKRKIESWIINVNDKKRARQIMRTLKESYDVDFGLSIRGDLDWLKMN